MKSHKIWILMTFIIIGFFILSVNLSLAASESNNQGKCDKSKGLMWCEEKQKCVIPFEESCGNLNDSKKILPLCLKQCLEARKLEHLSCIKEHSNVSKTCNLNYKECIIEVKVDFRNKEINISQFNKERRKCSNDYVSCLKENDKIRKNCTKGINEESNCEKKCKEQICALIYNPVCGEDNKTYSNECFLKNSNTKKACEGKCPCEICKNYYWSDNNNNECSRKKFCGLYMYEGLKTFETKEECKNEINNNTINNEKCFNDGNCKENQFCEKKCSNDTIQGKCTDVPEACILLYDPVCGCDGKTYSNDCIRKAAKISKKSDGECKTTAYYCSKNENCKENEFCKFSSCNNKIGKCAEVPEVCPLYFAYQPVCGCDGKTYSSECEMFHFKMSKKHNGACEEKDCETLNKDILEELKKVQKCISDEDCVFGNLNTPCTIYMCGAAYNKNSSLSILNEKSLLYIEKCEKFCPMYPCMNPNDQISKCSNNYCQTFYIPKTK